MHGIKHPFTGALYEVVDDGNIRVTDGDKTGLFRRNGSWLSGDIRECDPQLCNWVGGPADGQSSAGSEGRFLMSRETLVQLTKRSLAHARAGTVPQADAVMRVPATNYYDPERWALEMERVFRRVPLLLGFSAELAEEGSYRALDVAGTPVLLIRGSDGVLRSFVNMCSHRGAMLVEEGSGKQRRFLCPYHAWSYDTTGALVGVLDGPEFGEIDRSTHGLTELPCEERAGIIWGSVTPGADLHLDAWLCGYDEMLEHLGFADCTFVGRQQIAGPNWKVAYDGYLDFYHLPILHKNTFGPDYSNKAIYDAWGPHQRVTSPDHRILALDDIAEEDWSLNKISSGVWTIFPHVSIAAFEAPRKLYMVSQLFPGDDPDTSMTTQNFLATFEVDDDAMAAIEQQMAFLLGVVRDEDYYTGKRIQRTVKTGAKTHFMFGRNEAGGQRFHGWVDDLVGAADEDAYLKLLADADVVHQP